ncbi:MAG: hypothetical protein CSYNP_03084 [Syntrophus sp. SKADARSKE-3]|nr:hypothetical protein [Syntrophus sp. SKADARSKE-3]
MLNEEEIRERAKYCYCVYLQLSRLHENVCAEPEQYLEYLKQSSLLLAEDEFIKTIIEEENMTGGRDGGMSYLISLYEGFVHAYCEVLCVGLDEIREGIPHEFREKLAEEIASIVQPIAKKKPRRKVR